MKTWRRHRRWLLGGLALWAVRWKMLLLFVYLRQERTKRLRWTAADDRAFAAHCARVSA